MYSETFLERRHVRAVAQDRWSLFTGKINMICKDHAIEIIDFLLFSETTPVAIYRFYCTYKRYYIGHP